MNIYGQLENATFENLSADPSTAVQGRFWYNSTTLRPMLDDGTLKRALLKKRPELHFREQWNSG
jgi:hypothetical protein